MRSSLPTATTRSVPRTTATRVVRPPLMRRSAPLAVEAVAWDERLRLSGWGLAGEDEGEGEGGLARPKRERLEADWESGAAVNDERPSAAWAAAGAPGGGAAVERARSLDDEDEAGGGRVQTGWCARAWSQGAMAVLVGSMSWSLSSWKLAVRAREPTGSGEQRRGESPRPRLRLLSLELR